MKIHSVTTNIVLLCFLFPSLGWTQNAAILSEWKNYNRELHVGIGTSNFLGDLGGRNQIGSDFIWDLETSLFKPSVSVGYGKYFSPYLMFRSDINYFRLAGDDALTEEKFRHNRNLRFFSNTVDLAACAQLILPLRSRESHRYNLRDQRGRLMGSKYKNNAFYLFGGLAFVYSEPKAKYEGHTYKLRKLHTEGQGLENGAKPYKPITLGIPVGGGFRYALDRQWILNFEITYRFTISDYLDDVSTVYYDNASLANNFGAVSAALADPSLGYNRGDQLDPTKAGRQRGDNTDKDGYLAIQLGVTYRIKTNPNQPHGLFSSRKGLKNKGMGKGKGVKKSLF